MKFFKKKKGMGITGTILVLGLIAFTAAVTVPKLANRSNITRQKNIQVEAHTLLKDARQYITQDDLASLGVPADKPLTEDLFNSFEVVNVVNFLNVKGALNGFKATNLTLNNPNINLGNLKVLTNVPAKDIIVDGDGNLVKDPYIVQK
ncbi:MAG: hypothetical protein ACRDCW_06290 [Sarcina sp.]